MEYELTRLAADQLAKEMKEERVFQGFSEMDVTFWPTYRFLRQAYGEDGERKYDDGVCAYDGFSDNTTETKSTKLVR